jgi:hypothetical protein
MDDAEIAGVLGTDEASVFEVRVGLLRGLAQKVAPEHVDDYVPELQAVIAERVYAEPAEDATPAPAQTEVSGVPETGDEVAIEAGGAELDELPTGEAAPEPEAGAGDDRADLQVAPAWAHEPTEPAPTPAAPRKRRSALVYLVPLVLLAAIAAGIVALTGGGDDSASEPTAKQPPASTPADKPADDGKAADSKPKPRATRLTALGEGNAKGTASIDGDRLTLKLRGLADPQGGSYEVWLYDSIIDAKALGASQETKIDLDAKLPANAKDYEYVDVSLEPADDNPNHSGQSVLRVPVAKLAK